MKPLGYILLAVGILIGWALGVLWPGPGGPSTGGSSADRPAAEERLDGAGTEQFQQLSPAKAISGLGSEQAAESLEPVDLGSSSRVALGKAPRQNTGAAGLERASGSIRGSITTVAGAPLSGVQVRLSPLTADAQRLDLQVVSPSIQSPGEALNDQARRLLDHEARAIFGNSGQDGRFSLAVEAERVYSVVLSLPGWRFDRAAGQGSYVVAGAELSYLATPLASLALDLVDQAGQPLPAAVLAYASLDQGHDSWNYVAWNRAQPTIEFNAGSYRMVALSADAEPWCPERSALWLSGGRSQPQELTLAGSTEPRTERWELTPQPTLYGRVTLANAEARPAEGFGLALVPAGTEMPKAGAAGDGYRYFAGPHFLLTQEAAGSFDLRLKWKGAKQDQLLGHVDLPLGNLRQDFSVQDRPERLRWFVTAKGPDDQPMDSLGAIVFWVHSVTANTSNYFGSNPARLVGPGRFELRIPEDHQDWFYAPLEDPAKGAECGCDFTHPRYGTSTLTLVPGQSEYALQFREPGSLTVQITGATPSDAGHFWELALSQPAQPGGGASTLQELAPQVGPSGTWSGTITGLQPGAYEVALYLNKGSPESYSSQELARVTTMVISGSNRLALDLSLLRDLVVRVPEKRSGLMLLQPLDRQADAPNSSSGAYITKEGRAVFPNVAPGDYLLCHLLQQGSEFMLVSCPCDEVVFSPQPANCVKIVLEGDDHDLYRAGLRTGDLITAVDGSAYDSRTWQAAIQAQAAPRDLRLSVSRDGANFQLLVPNQAFIRTEAGFWHEFLRP